MRGMRHLAWLRAMKDRARDSEIPPSSVSAGGRLRGTAPRKAAPTQGRRELAATTLNCSMVLMHLARFPTPAALSVNPARPPLPPLLPPLHRQEVPSP